MIGADLLRFSDKKLLFLDMESQRLNLLDDNLPFQCSFIVANKYEILEKHNYYIKWPNFKMSVDAARITNFRQEWVENGDDPEFVLNAFESYLNDDQYIIVGHSILMFDLELYQLWRRAMGKKKNYLPRDRIIDTNLLARAYKMGWKPDRDNIIAWQYKVANTPQKGVKTNLLLMAKELEVEVDETKLHDATYDLIVNHGIYKKLINLIEI